MNPLDEKIEQYYRENPDQEVRDRRNQILEPLVPFLGGAAVGALSELHPKVREWAALRKGVAKYPSPAAVGAILATSGIGIPLLAVNERIRKKRALNAMGVDAEILGSYREPLKRKTL